jgi:hypothetical protein
LRMAHLRRSTFFVVVETCISGEASFFLVFYSVDPCFLQSYSHHVDVISVELCYFVLIAWLAVWCAAAWACCLFLLCLCFFGSILVLWYVGEGGCSACSSVWKSSSNILLCQYCSYISSTHNFVLLLLLFVVLLMLDREAIRQAKRRSVYYFSDCSMCSYLYTRYLAPTRWQVYINEYYLTVLAIL